MISLIFCTNDDGEPALLALAEKGDIAKFKAHVEANPGINLDQTDQVRNRPEFLIECLF